MYVSLQVKLFSAAIILPDGHQAIARLGLHVPDGIQPFQLPIRVMMKPDPKGLPGRQPPQLFIFEFRYQAFGYQLLGPYPGLDVVLAGLDVVYLLAGF